MDLEALFRAHQKEIYVYLLRTVGDRGTAEDLAQETFLRALRSAPLFRGESSLRTWLFAIARVTLADHIRRKRPEHPVPIDDRPARDRADAASDIGAVLGSLPVIAREVLVLCDVLGFAPTETAQILGIEPNAVRVRLHRARARFREVYRDE